MVIEFAEILRDLELKRAAALSRGRDGVAARAGRGARRARGRRGRRRGAVDRGAAAGMVADALAVLAGGEGDDADTVAARAIVRAVTADVSSGSRARDGHRARPVHTSSRRR